MGYTAAVCVRRQRWFVGHLAREHSTHYGRSFFLAIPISIASWRQGLTSLDIRLRGGGTCLTPRRSDRRSHGWISGIVDRGKLLSAFATKRPAELGTVWCTENRK
jgi:hypothetical protein